MRFYLFQGNITRKLIAFNAEISSVIYRHEKRLNAIECSYSSLKYDVMKYSPILDFTKEIKIHSEISHSSSKFNQLEVKFRGKKTGISVDLKNSMK